MIHAFLLLISLIAIPQPPAQPSGPDLPALDATLDAIQAELTAGRLQTLEPRIVDALRTATDAHDDRRIGRATVQLGWMHYSQGRYPEAVEELERGGSLAKAQGDVPTRMHALNILANVQRELGHLDQALTGFDEWLRLNATLDEPIFDGRILSSIGIVYTRMNDWAKAGTYFDRALAVARARNDHGLAAASLKNQALVLRGQGKPAEAVPMMEEALREIRLGQFPTTEAEILNSLGAGLYQTGRYDEAAARFEESLVLAKQTHYVGLEAQLTERLGEVEFMRKNYDAAQSAFERAEAMYREQGSPPSALFAVEVELAEMDILRERFDSAVQHYEEAMRLIELIEQFSLPTEMGRAFPFTAARETIDGGVAALTWAHREARALELADRGRARAFLALVSESRIDLRAGLTADQRAEEEALVKRVSQAKDRPADLAAALEAQQRFYVALHRSNPAYANLGRPQFATIERMQRELTPPGTTLIEYALGEKTSVVWVVTNTRVTSALLPGRTELKALVDRLRPAIAEPVSALVASSRQAQADEALRQLDAALLAPVRGAIPSGDRLLIVPDGVLAYVPFDALKAPNGRYLLEDHVVIYTQSAAGALAVADRAREQGEAPRRAMLAIGAPDYGGVPAERRGDLFTALPNARQEVETISRQFPSRDRDVLEGASATEAAVKSRDLSQYRQIHFAVHGLADEAHPEQSGLALGAGGADDGLLRIDEVARLRLNADLVTLSACRTGVGKLFEGEGLLSLSRAFFYAGARRVVASLWDVSDASTADLMKRFYERQRAGAAPEAALREAKLAMLRGDRTLWRHPYFWSAFVAFR